MLLLTTLVLGIVFVVLQWLGFQLLWSHGVQFEGSGAGQFLYIIFGLHALARDWRNHCPDDHFMKAIPG